MGRSAKVLAAGEVRQLLALIAQKPLAPRNTVIALLSFKAGLRACEIAGLEWSMVLGANGKFDDVIAIAGTIAKNGRSRQIPLHPELKQALIRLRRAAGFPVAGAVVQSQRGDHLTPRSVVNLFRKYYDELGFDGCSSHSGRRTFITQAARLIAKSGGSLRDIQELAGHRSMSSTELYIAGCREAQRKLVRLL